MNRVRLNPFLVVLAPLVFLAAIVNTPAHAQHMYIDTNGDGVHSSADVVNPSGRTTVAIWLDTHHDRDGSLQTCNSHTGAPSTWYGTPPDPGLDIFSYDIFLTVTQGTVVWGEYEDKMGFEELPNGDDVASGKQIHITRFARLGEENPAGLYKLGSMTVSVGAGTPSISFGVMVGGDYTCFGTHCSAGEEFPNSYVYGIDWFDAEGILYGGTINHEPAFDQPGPISVIENRTVDEVVTASDEDKQWLFFSKLSGPDYVTVSTFDLGRGVIHVAPQSSDVGTANVVVRVSDGIFWCDRTVPVTVRREFELSPQRDVTVTAGTIAKQYLHADNPLGQALTFYVASGPSFVRIESSAYGSYTRLSPMAQDIGTYTVTLGVTNGTARDEKSFTVVVARNGENHAPVAIAGGPIQGIVGHSVRLDGSRSSDPDGDRLSLTWTFGDGGGATGPIVEHRYTSEGDYTVSLTVRDPDLFAVGSTTAHIVAVAPARAYLAGGPAAILADQGRDICVRVEPPAGLFGIGDFDAAKISLDFPVTEMFGSLGAPRSITATGFDSTPDADGDRNGLADQGVVFSKSDFASMLGSIPEHHKIELTIRGELAGGGRFSAPVEVTVVRRGGILSAGISPNPLNPVGQLSFVTSRPGPADVKIFDVSGRLAHHAIDRGVLPAGYHEVLVGRGDRGEELPSGVYFYRIETLEGVARGRFAIVR